RRPNWSDQKNPGSSYGDGAPTIAEATARAWPAALVQCSVLTFRPSDGRHQEAVSPHAYTPGVVVRPHSSTVIASPTLPIPTTTTSASIVSPFVSRTCS